MKKRIGAVLLAGVMMLSMTGCGSDQKAKKYGKYVELGDYKGIEYVLEVADVTDEDIDAQIDSFLTGLTETEEVTDRAVKDGDTVNIDYVGTKDGEEFDGGTAEGYDLVIGSNSFIDGFETGLIGHEIGEEVSLDLTFPDDYPSEDLAGAKVNFAVTINSISVSNVPTLSDKLVADNTEYDTIDAYKESIRKDLQASNEDSAKQQAKSDVFSKVVENSNITGYDEKEVQDLIDKEFNSFKETAQSYEAYGYSYEDVLASNGYASEDELKEGITEYVKNYLNQVMVLYCIADKEKINVSTEEIENMVKEYMESYSVETKEEVYDYFGEEYFEVSILSEKVMDFLMENAKQVDELSDEGDSVETEPVSPEDAEGEAATEEATTEAE
ncbi:MAG: trigger factor [Lachnospiraceae bacterium]